MVIATILVGQVALSIAAQTGISADPLLMAVTCAASFAFMTPFSHKANLLVMGAGGYSVKDYFKVGVWLNLLLIAALVFVVPLFYGL